MGGRSRQALGATAANASIAVSSLDSASHALRQNPGFERSSDDESPQAAVLRQPDPHPRTGPRRILLVAQPGWLADGMIRSLAQIEPGAQVSLRDPGQSALDPAPDLVVVDVDATDHPVSVVVARMVDAWPGVPVIVLGSVLDETLMLKAMEAGARAYLPKTCSEAHALGVLRAALEDADHRIDAKRTTATGKASGKSRRPPKKQVHPYGLTRAELEVLSLLCDGRPSAEIAKLRGSGEGTVKAHLNKVYRKLGVTSRIGAVRIGQRLYEVHQRQIQRNQDRASVYSWPLPYMTLESRRQGEVLFRKGEPARRLYIIQKGRVLLPEVGNTMKAGDLFGEIGIFTPSHTRTCSAVCESDTKLFWLDADVATRLFFEHPQFAYHIMQLIGIRLLADASRAR